LTVVKAEIVKYTLRDVDNTILSLQHWKSQLTLVKNSYVTLKMYLV